MAIYPDHIKCFGCSFGVQKRMDALAWLLHLKDWKAALKVAHKYVFLPETARQMSKKSDRRAPTMRDIEIYTSILESVCADRKVWLHSRGLTNQTIRTARLGHNGAAFVIPVFDEKIQPVTLRYRNDEEICGKYDEEFDEDLNVIKTRKIAKYRGWTGKNDACLYPAWKFAASRLDYVVAVEGELDALLLWQHGIPAITATNGASQQGLVIDLLLQFFGCIASDPRRRPSIRQFVVCGDRDAPGIEAARKLFERAREVFEEVIWLQWPFELGKDITEVMQKGYSFEQIATEWGFTEDRSPTDRAGNAGHDAGSSDAEDGGGTRETGEGLSEACRSDEQEPEGDRGHIPIAELVPG